MTLQISTITDKNIRKAAQEADSQGTRAFNGILDKEEVSLFIKYAKNMNCNMTEVINIANRIGVDKNTQSTINRETQITNLKDVLGITQIENTISEMNNSLNTTSHNAERISAIGEKFS